MGNKTSTGTDAPAVLSNYSPRNEVENNYARSIPERDRPTPPSPPIPKRAYTISDRHHKGPGDAIFPAPPSLRSSSDAATMRPLLPPKAIMDAPSSDSIADHIIDLTPCNDAQDMPLGTSIVVCLDREVKTVNVNKLFEMTCDSIDPAFNPVKGKCSYDPRQQKAEFHPTNTLCPNALYTVVLHGRAITTSQCMHSSNISDKVFTFHTCNPEPKSIGIRLKGNANSEKVHITNYFDLYNSLIIWSTRKWGCSGEHITGLYSETNEGKLAPLRADHDVLNLKEHEIVVVEIKD